MITDSVEQLPSAIPLAGWYGDELKKSGQGLFYIRPDEAAEIDEALSRAEAQEKHLFDVTSLDFPLPTLGARLEQITASLEHDPGFALLRGLPLVGKTMSQIRLLYWGIGLYLGVALGQTADGRVIVDIRDNGTQPGESKLLRRHTSNLAMGFHADSSDVVALLCINKPLDGGTSLLASSFTVRQELSWRHPELLPVLQQKLPFVDISAQSASGRKYFGCPVYGTRDGYFTSRYYGGRILNTPDIAGVPALSPLQRRAVEAVGEIAATRGVSLELDFQPGDLQLANNHLIYHSRTAFTDGDSVSRKRHLLRMWFSVPSSRPLPPEFEDAWGDTEAGALRGGVLHWQLRGNLGEYQRRQAAALDMKVNPRKV